MNLFMILGLWVVFGIFIFLIDFDKKEEKKIKEEKKRKRFFIKKSQAKKEPSLFDRKKEEKELVLDTKKEEEIILPKEGSVYIADFKEDEIASIEEKEEISILQAENEEVSFLPEEEGYSIYEQLELGDIYKEKFLKEKERWNMTKDKEEIEDFVEEDIMMDEEVISGEYSTFSHSMEPWYEHESIKKIIGTTDFLKKEPKEFEIEEETYV